ncbi:MAG: hypothetical protein JWN17_687 [Frankiales bacterium]|nr:hypothetical protein [Frankiales bacterium]
MPETTFTLRFPDERVLRCYSPSLVVHEHLPPGTVLPVSEVLTRSRLALRVASDRVQERYGFPCSMAAASLQAVETAVARYTPTTPVTVQG